MRVISRGSGLLVAVALVVAAALVATLPAAAQTPGAGFGPGPFRGMPPSGGGFGLMVMDRDQDREHLLLHLQLQDCEPHFLGVTVDGRWRTYVVGAPPFVNAAFPGQFRANDVFMVGCTGVRPDLRLTEADTGTTVTLEQGERLRVVLESNASTGYAWSVTVAPHSSVLIPVGEPFYVPAATNLLGAAGHQVFDFEAVGSGSTSMTLSYARPGVPSEPAADEFSVSVNVP